MGWETREAIQSSAPYFTPSKTILKSQDHLRVKLYLFGKVLGPLQAIWGNWVKNLIHRQGNTRNNSKSSTPHFTSKEALLSCKGHARSCQRSCMTSLSAKSPHKYNNVCSSRLVILIFGQMKLSEMDRFDMFRNRSIPKILRSWTATKMLFVCFVDFLRTNYTFR